MIHRAAKALTRIEKCSGECKKCKHLKIVCAKNALVYAFLCEIADKAGYLPYSNTTKELREITINCLNFELS